MLLSGKKLEQDIMLWANTHNLSDGSHVVEHVNTVQVCFTGCLGEQTGQHVDRCCLTSAVVAKQYENLVFVHLKVDSINSLEVIVESLLEVTDLEDLVLVFFLTDLWIDTFIGILEQVLCLKVFWVLERSLRCSLSDLFALAAAHEEE